eukprot:gb/GECH01011357.1/.p1 GENE.gb/GECH01011357.1/~~gb/GECH01011357.1/.p1  ORF type:complete len:402 (+),score=103.67 gb/GECH01011357.1/:1-1206(+)
MALLKELNSINKLDEQVENEGQEDQDNNSKDPFVAKANDVVHMKLIRNHEEFEHDYFVFHPEYTHQSIDNEEEVHGYINPRLNLYFNAATLDTFINFTYDKKTSDPLKRKDDLIERLTKKTKHTTVVTIPYQFTSNPELFLSGLNKPFQPMGEQIHSYQRDDKTFEIYKGNLSDERLAEYAVRLQTFVLFFIDGACQIEFDDPKWEIFMIFERYSTDTEDVRYGLIGFCTLYPFWAYPNNNRLRISQFLIVPSFQKQGHGSELLRTIYNDALARECIEVCVEDPSDDFMMLRDLTDLRICKEQGYFDDEFEWSHKKFLELRNKCKLNKQQLRKCYEIFKFSKLDPKDEEAKKRFRLDVKRRIYKENEEDIGHIRDADERKRILQKLYEVTETQYRDLLEKI